MTETQFIENNQEDWNALEQLLKSPLDNSSELQDLFVKVSGDLAFASTYFPNRSVRVYLNLLTQRVFDSLSKNKTQVSLAGLVTFFTDTLPIELYRSRKALLFSLLFFIAMLVIGAVSTAYDDDFARVVLGDTYVNMTEDNINSGDPMAVYKDANKTDMFLGITINNIRVSFITYILGIFASLGTIIILMYNGIMVGTFQYFFYTKGLFTTSFLTIWIHGTIEISAIIIAGAAGIVLGSGLLFPATYSRLVSLQVSAIRSLKILLSTVPLFFIAGFLESFVTRQTDLPDIVKLGIIVVSLIFILYIYWYYPKKVAGKLDYNPAFHDVDRLPSEQVLNPIGSHNTTEILLRSVRDYASAFSNMLKYWIGPLMLGFIGFAYLSILVLEQVLVDFTAPQLMKGGGLLICIVLQYKVVVLILKDERFKAFMFEQSNRLLILAWSTILMTGIEIVYSIHVMYGLITLVVIPIPVMYLAFFSTEGSAIKDHTTSMFLGYTYYARSLLITLIVVALYYVLNLLLSSSLMSLFFEYFDIHDGITSTVQSRQLYNGISRLLVSIVIIPLVTYINLYVYIAYVCSKEGKDILLKLETFGSE